MIYISSLQVSQSNLCLHFLLKLGHLNNSLGTKGYYKDVMFLYITGMKNDMLVVMTILLFPNTKISCAIMVR